MSDTPSHPALSNAATGVRQSVFAALQGRIDAYRASGGTLIPLQIGDTFLAPPEACTEVDVTSDELSLYGAVTGLDTLRAAIADWRRGRGLSTAQSKDNVHVGCGCTHALFCASRAVLNPGDEVLVTSPYWPLIPGVLRTAGAVPVEVPLTQRLYDEPRLDAAAVLREAMTTKTRAVYLITPNNPDGQIYTARQLQQIAAFAAEHDLWVLADEVYADFVYEGEHVSMANLPDMASRTVTTYSISKSHGLAGARIGYVVASEAVIAAARRMSNHTVYNVAVPMQRAALAAVQAGDGWIDDARATYRSARDAGLVALGALGLETHAPRGGAFFFVDLASRLRGRPLQRLLEHAIDHGVLLAPGDAFGAGYGTHARLCFTGVREEAFVDGIRRLGRALEALGT